LNNQSPVYVSDTIKEDRFQAGDSSRKGGTEKEKPESINQSPNGTARYDRFLHTKVRLIDP
jgi:hypothetical protein